VPSPTRWNSCKSCYLLNRFVFSNSKCVTVSCFGPSKAWEARGFTHYRPSWVPWWFRRPNLLLTSLLLLPCSPSPASLVRSWAAQSMTPRPGDGSFTSSQMPNDTPYLQMLAVADDTIAVDLGEQPH
jgi:hypothetical protein